jgi:hypothetical protein
VRLGCGHQIDPRVSWATSPASNSSSTTNACRRPTRADPLGPGASLAVTHRSRRRWAQGPPSLPRPLCFRAQNWGAAIDRHSRDATNHFAENPPKAQRLVREDASRKDGGDACDSIDHSIPITEVSPVAFDRVHVRAGTVGENVQHGHVRLAGLRKLVSKYVATGAFTSTWPQCSRSATATATSGFPTLKRHAWVSRVATHLRSTESRVREAEKTNSSRARTAAHGPSTSATGRWAAPPRWSS